MDEKNGSAKIHTEMVTEIVAQRGIEPGNSSEGAGRSGQAFVPD